MMKQNFPSYRKDLIEKARKLRKNSTPGEIELWRLIKNKQVLGYQFRRQRPILSFIIDFYCKELALAIEIDGSSHDYKIGYDKFRQSKLEEIGITFLRFPEKDTKENPDFVVLAIERWISNNYFTHPSIPSKEGKFFNEIKNLTNGSSSPWKTNKSDSNPK